MKLRFACSPVDDLWTKRKNDMASICSAHMGKDPSCKACNSTIYDLFSKEVVDDMNRRAEAAGEINCSYCGFRFYATTSMCPACQGTDPIVDVMNI
jgi:hypothetical protein